MHLGFRGRGGVKARVRRLVARGGGGEGGGGGGGSGEAGSLNALLLLARSSRELIYFEYILFWGGLGWN